MNMPRRPGTTTIEPRTFDYGSIAGQHHDVDIPFADPSDPEAFARVLHYLVEKLPEPDRSAVQMCAMKGLTYEEAAELFEPELGRLVDRKTVWRWARRGTEQLEQWLSRTPWIGVLMDGRIPLPPVEDQVVGLLRDTPLDEPNKEQGHE